MKIGWVALIMQNLIPFARRVLQVPALQVPA
jgi:hypothetical protein